MHLISTLVISIALAMDAFAVSVCKGLSIKKVTFKNAALVGLYFGGFQTLMPVLGYLLGMRFKGVIERFDHWIAFGLLAIIGARMIYESLKSGGEVERESDPLNPRKMLPLAVATSIDALAVGVSFAFLNEPLYSSIIIGAVTFVICAVGVKIGQWFGARMRSKAELFGGVILILMGAKILLEHLG